MNTHDELPGSLRGALQRHADGVGDDHPFTLDDVKGRAHGIRRRRIAVSGLAAAAVLAIAVPLGLNAAGTPGAAPSFDPAGPSPSRTAEPTPSETAPVPADPTGVRLTTDVPAGVAAPGVDYAYRDRIVPADAPDSPVRTEAAYQELAPLGDGWVGVWSEGEDITVDLVAADGSVTWSGPGDFGLSASSDGTVVAFGAPGGRIFTVTEGDEPQQLYDGPLSAVVAVTGSDACDAEHVCTVWANEITRTGAFSVTSTGERRTVPDLMTLRGVAPDGSLAGTVSATDDGSCSALLEADGTERWRTCDHTLGGFSADGRYVLGRPSYLDGAGDGRVAMLDAATGDVVAEAVNDMRSQAFVSVPRFDVDGSLLLPTMQDGTWRLLRLTAAGQLVAAVPGDFPSKVDAYVTDLHLAVRP